MRALWLSLVRFYTRWKYVEDVEAASSCVTPPPADELTRLRQAIAREERNLVHFRRFDCDTLARSSESSLRALHRRLHALELAPR